MDTNLIVGKVVDGKEIVSASFDEVSQFTTAYFADGTFRVFTAGEAVEAFSDAETFVHIVTDEEASNIMAAGTAEPGFEIAGGDLISAPIVNEAETDFAGESVGVSTEVDAIVITEDTTAGDAEFTVAEEGTEPVEITEPNENTND